MTKTTNIRHSSEEARWGSPVEPVEIAKAVLGRISVDPFSELRFNELIGAERILTGEKGLDGFHDRWIDVEDCPRADWLLADFPQPEVVEDFTALVNPPGSDDGDNVKRAWRLLDAYHRLGWFGGGAIWVAFNLNQFQTLQGISPRSPLSQDFIRCIPDHRLAFIPHKKTDEREQPSHPSFFVLLPSSNEIAAAEQRRLFESMASKLGEVF